MTESTFNTIAPLCERIVSLEASIEFFSARANQLEAESWDADDMKERFSNVTEAQKRINKLQTLREEQQSLIAQVRTIAGKWMGMAKAKEIADQYTNRITA